MLLFLITDECQQQFPAKKAARHQRKQGCVHLLLAELWEGGSPPPSSQQVTSPALPTRG